MRNALSTTVIGIAAAAVCTLLAAREPASATNYQVRCENSWERSDAQEYCPDPVISWFMEKGGNLCGVRATCTVNVRVGDSEQEFRKELDAITVSPKGLTICFRSTRNADGSLHWSMSMNSRCGSATDVATAVSNGLPAR